MGIVCNGPQKSGTNALRAIVASLGFESVAGGFEGGHYRHKRRGTRVPWSEFEPELGAGQVISGHDPSLTTSHVHLRLVRDRRNIAVSWFRAIMAHRGEAISPQAFRRWLMAPDARKMYGVLARFSDWFDRDDAFHYETLFDPAVVMDIARRCGVPYRQTDAYGKSGTWTGRPSQWSERFDDHSLKWFQAKLIRISRKV